MTNYKDEIYHLFAHFYRAFMINQSIGENLIYAM